MVGGNLRWRLLPMGGSRMEDWEVLGHGRLDGGTITEAGYTN